MDQNSTISKYLGRAHREEGPGYESYKSNLRTRHIAILYLMVIRQNLRSTISKKGRLYDLSLGPSYKTTKTTETSEYTVNSFTKKHIAIQC